MKTTRSRRGVRAHDDIRERQRIRQRKKKRIRFTIFCIGMLLLASIAVCAIIFLTPWFQVSEVQVKGNVQLEAADLIAASEIKKGESIFAFSMRQVEEKLLAVPYVKTVTVKRKLPKTIVLDIAESRAIAYVVQDGLQVCLDETGEVVYAGAQVPENLIAVTGIAIESYKPGIAPVVENPEAMELFLELVSATEECGCIDKVHGMDLSNKDNIIFTYGQGIKVLCGDSYDLKHKILTFMEVARELPSNAKGEIDLRISGKAYYRP